MTSPRVARSWPWITHARRRREETSVLFRVYKRTSNTVFVSYTKTISAARCKQYSIIQMLIYMSKFFDRAGWCGLSLETWNLEGIRSHLGLWNTITITRIAVDVLTSLTTIKNKTRPFEYEQSAAFPRIRDVPGLILGLETITANCPCISPILRRKYSK